MIISMPNKMQRAAKVFNKTPLFFSVISFSFVSLELFLTPLSLEFPAVVGLVLPVVSVAVAGLVEAGLVAAELALAGVYVNFGLASWEL